MSEKSINVGISPVGDQTKRNVRDLSKLFNESSYSEGDPVRQLLSAGKAIKEWPMDALAWGADLVDLGSSGLAKLFQRRPELARMLQTDLGGNLRRATSDPLYSGEPSFSVSRAQDLEEGRSIGRMLNPLLLLNFKIPTDIARISKTKNIPVPKEIESTKSVIDSESRRDFMKKSAGIAGGSAAASIPGAKLLQKFAPEEHAIAKEVVAETAPKYKYNSLKEYLDDVTDYSHDIGHERAYESAMEHGYNNHPGADRYMDNFIDNFDFSKIQRERLLQDEQTYSILKHNSKQPGARMIQDQESYLNSFSPQTKKEMKEYKDFVKQYRGEENWSRPDDMMDWINGDRIPF